MRILSLDLGKRNIKMVEVESHFGKFEVRDYHVAKVDPTLEDGPFATASAIIDALPRAPDRLVLTLPSAFVTTRNLTLPTRDKKALQTGVFFELEDELPFELDDAAADFVVTQTQGTQTSVHVIVTLKKHLEAFLEKLKAWHLDPEIITTDAWSLSRLLKPKSDQPELLIQFGETHTMLLAMQGPQILMTRVLPWGGAHFRNALVEGLKLDYSETDTVLRDQGFIVPPSRRTQATEEQLRFSDLLEPTLKRLLFDLKQAHLGIKSSTQKNFHMIQLSGGLALLPGLREFLEEELAVQTQLFRPMSVQQPRVEFSDSTEAEFALALGMAVAFSSNDRKEHLHFRKKEFAKDAGPGALDWSSLKYPTLAASAVLASFVLSQTTQNWYYSKRMEEVDSQLEKSLRGFFGTLSASQARKKLEDPDALQASVQRELDKQRHLAELLNPNPQSPLLYLKDLSQGISKDVVVDLVQFKMGLEGEGAFQPDSARTASLTFYVATPQIAERLGQLLNRHIGQLQRSKMEEVDSLDGSGKRWKITFSGTALKPAS